MSRRVAIAAACVALGAVAGLMLGRCDRADGGVRAEGGPASTQSAVAPSVVPAVADPAPAGCESLRGLGTGGTPAQYRAIAAGLTGARDGRLAAAAMTLHDATGNSLAGADRFAMLGAVLDVAEECLRVTG